MSKSNSLENSLLALLFNATAFADVAENDTSAPLTNLYVSLHTADPGEAGDQTTSEATYTGHNRVAVARSGAGWTVSGNQVTNAAAVTFDACTGGTNTITHFGIGSAASGAGVLYYSGSLTAPLAVSSGVVPSFPIGAIVVTED